MIKKYVVGLGVGILLMLAGFWAARHYPHWWVIFELLAYICLVWAFRGIDGQ